MIVKILDVDYEIRVDDPKQNEMLGDDSDGYTNFEKKEIVLAVKDDEKFLHPILRHELIHAFMYESGLGSSWEHHTVNGHDETTVDWFAIQYPKMHKLFAHLGIEDF